MDKNLISISETISKDPCYFPLSMELNLKVNINFLFLFKTAIDNIFYVQLLKYLHYFVDLLT